MSEMAERIEAMRRAFVAALGTNRESAAKADLEREIQKAKKKS